MRYSSAWICLSLIVLVTGHRTRAASDTQPAATVNPERAKWENRIAFFGEEATGLWSLRIHDKDVDRDRQFKLTELWKYDLKSKQWNRLDAPAVSAKLIPNGQRDKDPQNPDDDNQTLYVFPVDQNAFGLFYADWTVDGIHGSTFCRIGPGLERKSALAEHRAPEGTIFAAVPTDLTHAVGAYIPDPRIACEGK